MKKFWQHLIVWQKAAVFLFVFLSLVFIMVFLGVPKPLKICFSNLNQIIATKKEDLKIYTNKTLYTQGEPILITLESTTKSELIPYHLPPGTSIHKYFGENYGMGMIEKFENNSWEPIEPVWRCGNACFHECIYNHSFSALEKRDFEWNQSILICDKNNRTEKTEAVEPGKYRIVSYIQNSKKEGYKKISSGEFIIQNDIQEKLSLITDKMFYSPKEEITVTTKNKINLEIEFSVISVEYFKGKRWNQVRFDIDCPCLAKCKKLPTTIKPNSDKEFLWDQELNDCTLAKEGKYRFKTGYWRKNFAERDAPVYSNEFFINSDSTKNCEKDTNCEARLSHCDCKYHCVNKNIEIDDCTAECIMLPSQAQKPECVCSENQCVEASKCDVLKSEINDLIEQVKYCEKDSDCSLNESIHFQCPFGYYLISGINDDGEIISLIQEKIKEYSDNCEICEYEIPIPPEQENIKCENNICVEDFSSSENSTKSETPPPGNIVCAENSDCEIAYIDHCCGKWVGCFNKYDNPPETIGDLDDPKCLCLTQEPIKECDCVDSICTPIYEEVNNEEEKKKVEEVYNTYLFAEKNCDIELANSVITEKSNEIMHYTCSNMANERKCYVGRDFEIAVKEDKAVLYLTPFSRQIENPFFFAKENGEWKLDFYNMAYGLAMGGSTCDSGWDWKGTDLREIFCNFFPEGECLDK